MVHSEAQGKATCHVVDRECWKPACNQPEMAGGQSRTMTTVKVVIQRAVVCLTASMVENALIAEALSICLGVSLAGSVVSLTAEPRGHRKQEGWLELMFMLLGKQGHSCSDGTNKSSQPDRCSLWHKNAFNPKLSFIFHITHWSLIHWFKENFFGDLLHVFRIDQMSWKRFWALLIFMIHLLSNWKVKAKRSQCIWKTYSCLTEESHSTGPTVLVFKANISLFLLK